MHVILLPKLTGCSGFGSTGIVEELGPYKSPAFRSHNAVASQVVVVLTYPHSESL